ncbi:serine/threonine protein phosphatase PstP [Gordonia effusa NBRC 100432]|uniref:Serine/threonine protein phosphatase PstP n=1 Tax=Gordonia effusa NBRC 100432 TaxID=1077974 RepID=H0QWV8_9ACTN|nr:PP2C family serine/threonine-protein phosphatase [Gordonia effusa]GAB17309.1 serine/threonine protein phosphatase PstP [Gordonia effusa NBRC 100432]
MTLVLRYIARSDRGLVRSNNEDSVYAGARLLAIADGMGGHAAGEVASQLVIGALRGLDDDEPGGNLLDKLSRATAEGNAAIAAQVEHSPELDGMGTTLTAILFAGPRIGLCHVGDSRAYLYRDGQLTQITRDDTFVQTLVDEGRITAEQAHTHPQRSLIMRALTGTEVEPTLTMREARAGDRYILCSDGLSDVVSEETLAETIGSIDDNHACADRLIELALRGGGPDNVTVIVADVVADELGESRPIVGGAAGGDDQDGYVPNPSTAAGRAAALRPPAATPQRPTITEPEVEKPPRSPWRIWLIVGAIITIIAIIIAALLITRSKINSNYYVGERDGNVAIFQGTPDKILFVSLGSPYQRVCAENLADETPNLTFVDNDSEGPCTALPVKTLDEVSRGAINSGAIKNFSLPDAQQKVRDLTLLPLCAEPKPQPTPQPTPQPGPGPTPSPTTTTTAPSQTPSDNPFDGEGRTCRKPSS